MTYKEFYNIIHPLNDRKEVKVDVDSIGRMKLSKLQITILFLLQIYTLVMSFIVLFSILSNLTK